MTKKTDVLGRFFGGQGTVNVPCWSPDGDRIVSVTQQLVPRGPYRRVAFWNAEVNFGAPAAKTEKSGPLKSLRNRRGVNP